MRDTIPAPSILLAVALLGGCEQANQYVPPPPPKVAVAKPLQQTVTDYLDFTGSTAAFVSVEIRARVPGFLNAIHFTPGTRVDEEQLLFEIDPREYEAGLQATQAELESAKAQLSRAEIELKRAQGLYKQKAGSESDVVKWRGDRDIAKAAVLRAEAALERSRLDLSFTQVRSPISGMVSRNLVDIGNLVGEAEPTLLTTVSRYDPIYAYFNLNERDLLMAMDRYRSALVNEISDSRKETIKRVEIPLQLGLADEVGYSHDGIVDYAETEVDPGTGTLQIRGVFPNPGQVPKLLPGLFARIRMPIEQRDNALLVSERAIGADQGGPYVLVVASDNQIEKRPIRQGQLINGMRVIEEGLQADEWLVVKGVQRARPGAQVDPEQIDMAALSTSAMSETAAEKVDSTAPATNDDEGRPASDEATESAPDKAQSAQAQPTPLETEAQPATSSPAPEQSTSTPEKTGS